MYEFVRNMFIMGRIDNEGVQDFVIAGHITRGQAEQIIAQTEK